MMPVTGLGRTAFRIGAALVAGAAITGGVVVARRLLHQHDASELDRQHPMYSPIRQAHNGHHTVRIMTFNIKAAHGTADLGTASRAERERNLREIAAFIREANPDVVLLQETERNFHRKPGYELTDMYQGLQRLTKASDAGMVNPAFGVAIITRNGYHLRDDQTRQGSNLVRRSASGPGSGSTIAAVVEPPKKSHEKPFTILNGHLDAGDVAGVSSTFIRAIDRIPDGDPTAFPNRMIFGGDFNDTTVNVASALASVRSATDVFSARGVAASQMWPRSSTGAPIFDRDQIHVGAGFGKVRMAEVLDPRYVKGPMKGEPLSDHRPVIADIDL